MKKNAVVTGAGSGVGQAIAIALAREGWQVAIIGRRRETLLQTRRLAGAKASRIFLFPCDIGDEKAVTGMGRSVLKKLGPVEVLVNAAGTNAPNRALEVLSLRDYHAMIDANLNGAYYCTQAFLPEMRRRQSGTVVNIVSDAGKAASPKAGPAYVMSKFGLSGLTQSINAEERSRGVRACAVFPGDIDTPLLDKRPSPPPPEARLKMLRSEDVAVCAMLAINMPPRALIEEIIVRPR
jgi:NAD(P)-dependent dehydrogenase (short-subunit alcohol dehydrogenase family)